MFYKKTLKNYVTYVPMCKKNVLLFILRSLEVISVTLEKSSMILEIIPTTLEKSSTILEIIPTTLEKSSTILEIIPTTLEKSCTILEIVPTTLEKNSTILEIIPTTLEKIKTIPVIKIKKVNGKIYFYLFVNPYYFDTSYLSLWEYPSAK